MICDLCTEYSWEHCLLSTENLTLKKQTQNVKKKKQQQQENASLQGMLIDYDYWL